MKISIDELIRDLKHLSVETGSLACSGCGHEHNCSIHGCALIRKTVSVIEVFGGVFTEDACVKLAASYLDVTPEQLKAWTVAHKEDRLVELPCTPRLKPYAQNCVYIIDDGEIYEEYVWEVIIGENSAGEIVTVFSLIDGGGFSAEDIGVSVFRTPEAARTVLNGISDAEQRETR